MLGLVELQGSTDAVDDGVGDAGGVTPFETLVVLGAHAREQGDLLAAQAWNAATATEVGQPSLRGGEL